jgi:shikimate kinase
MKIYLVGLAGSGKTTLGKLLAEKLHLPFVDLDREIEKKEGVYINEIFRRRGEDHFRKVEAEVLKSWSMKNAGFVMATGGGTPAFFDNMLLMNLHGKTVFLDVPVREIANRILQTSQEDRPLLAGLGPEALKDKIEFLRTQRMLYYNQATIKVQGAEIQVDEIINLLQN